MDRTHRIPSPTNSSQRTLFAEILHMMKNCINWNWKGQVICRLLYKQSYLWLLTTAWLSNPMQPRPHWKCDFWAKSWGKWGNELQEPLREQLSRQRDWPCSGIIRGFLFPAFWNFTLVSNVRGQDEPEAGRPEQPTLPREAPGYPFRPLGWQGERGLIVPESSTPSLSMFTSSLNEPIYSSSPDLPYCPYSKIPLPAEQSPDGCLKAFKVHMSQKDLNIFLTKAFLFFLDSEVHPITQTRDLGILFVSSLSLITSVQPGTPSF